MATVGAASEFRSGPGIREHPRGGAPRRSGLRRTVPDDPEHARPVSDASLCSEFALDRSWRRQLADPRDFEPPPERPRRRRAASRRAPSPIPPRGLSGSTEPRRSWSRCTHSRVAPRGFVGAVPTTLKFRAAPQPKPIPPGRCPTISRLHAQVVSSVDVFPWESRHVREEDLIPLDSGRALD